MSSRESFQVRTIQQNWLVGASILLSGLSEEPDNAAYERARQIRARQIEVEAGTQVTTELRAVARDGLNGLFEALESAGGKDE